MTRNLHTALMIVFIGLVFGGCASLGYPPGEGSSMTTSMAKPRELTNLRQVKMGMTPQEIVSVMGDNIVIGYELTPENETEYRPILLKNPYRRQTFKVDEKTYEVDFYYTHLKKADDIISEDELTPFVFEDGRLVAKDWQFFNKLVKRPQAQF